MFADLADSAVERRIRGIKAVDSRPVVRRIRQQGGIGPARGVEISVTLDDKAFEGSGVFLLFGVVARRGAAAGFGGDPVPQALVITGLVVAFAATALAVALLLRLFEQTGQVTLRSDG